MFDQPAQPVLKARDAAKFLGVTKKTLQRWEAKNIITPQRTLGGHRIYTQTELDNLKHPSNNFQLPSTNFQSNNNSQFSIGKKLASNNFQLVKMGTLAMVVGIAVSSLLINKCKIIGNCQLQNENSGKAAVLAASDSLPPNLTFTVNVPADFKQNITAPNIVYSFNGQSGEISFKLEAGTGISVSGNKITNSGITALTAGSGITVDGNKITNSGITSLTAGDGISVSGSTITNSRSAPDYALSGWTDSGTSVGLTTTADSVIMDTITFGNATVTNGKAIKPSVDLGSDLGSSALRFNNLWVANINSNSSQSFSGQTTFSYAPTDTTISQASVLINPTTSAANGQLLGLSIAGYQKALIDEDGDIILGYSDATSAPATDYPLDIYGHSGTRVSFVDTSGNFTASGSLDINGLTSDIAGTLNLSGNALTSSGALSITPAAGNNLNIALSTTGDFAVNTNQLYVDTSEGRVGIGTTGPNRKLEILTTASNHLRLTLSTDTSKYVELGTNTAGYLTFKASGGYVDFYDGTNSYRSRYFSGSTEKILLNSDGSSYFSGGNVGIGTTSPGSKLDVSSTDGTSILTLTNLSNTEYDPVLKFRTGATPAVRWTAGVDDSDSDKFKIEYADGLGGATPSFVMTSDGKIGIGTTSPLAKLNVVGNVQIGPSGAANNGGPLVITQSPGGVGMIHLRPAAGNSTYITFTEADVSDNGAIGFTAGSQTMNFYTGGNITTGSIKMSILSGGNVGIGTTSPGAKLDIAAVVGTDALRLSTSGTKVLGLSTSTNGAALDLLASSTEPTNALTNGNFDTDLTSWSEVPSYTLNDQFTTDRAAGAVNGTAAEPTGGTRTVVDTTTGISITSGSLSYLINTTANSTVSYSDLTRGTGKIIISEFTSSNSSGGAKLLTSSELFYLGGSGVLNAATVANAVGTFNAATSYKVALIMRATGVYYYIKGGTEYPNWTLVYITSTGSGNLTPQYNIGGNIKAYTSDFIRIPTSTWLPTPLAYDTFTRADGAIGSSETTGPDSQTTPSLAWTGGAISTNKNVITPSLGSDVIINGTFDTDTSWTKGTGWTIGSGVATATSAPAASLIYQDSQTVNTWYRTDWTQTITSGNFRLFSANNIDYGSNGTYFEAYRSININAGVRAGSETTTGTIDNYSVKPLTLSSLFSTVSTSDSDVIADANVTLTAGTQAGLVTNLDSTSSPANFLIAYHDGTNVHLEKNVAGTYTSLINTAATYSAGATLRVITYTSGGSLKVRVYYNNALVGTEQTVSDAGIISNTKHGLFSTYSGNSFDNFTLFARGTGAEYTGAPFEELTPTRDTTTKYAGAASAKLVAGGTDGNYLQSVNVGDTNTYNLIAYAYTDGSAVTSADVELYYDTTTLTTTYAPIGGNGWYKLTGSFTGVASAKDYGVRVKAGKTVYVDEMKVQEGTATNQTFYVMNSGTGVTGLNVQGSVNATLNGIATLVKAGAISDSDFSDTVRDGLFGFDTTNHRLYFREGGIWSYIARTAGFQIPKEEVAGLSGGDYLIPYVESFMSDGAVHGMYEKFDLNALLAAQGAVTFTGRVTFNDQDMAGTAVISAYTNRVDVKFSAPFTVPPVITYSLNLPDENDKTFLDEGRKTTLANVSTAGFSILLDSLASRDFTYNWIAIAAPNFNTIKSESGLSRAIEELTPAIETTSAAEISTPSANPY